MGRKVAASHRTQHSNSVIWQTLSDRSRLSGDGLLDLFTVHQPGTSFLLSLEITALKHRQPSDTKAPLKPAITPPCISLILNQRKKKKGTCIFFFFLQCQSHLLALPFQQWNIWRARLNHPFCCGCYDRRAIAFLHWHRQCQNSPLHNSQGMGWPDTRCGPVSLRRMRMAAVKYLFSSNKAAAARRP